MCSTRTPHEIAVEINTVLSTDLQAQLKCGICYSTLKSPVVPSCNHPFCKECIEMCFQRKNSIECPMCRQVIKRRSCVPSEPLDAIVNSYLQLARAFKRDLKESAVSIPKEAVFLESQAIVSTQMMDSPMRDFVPIPQFAVPKPIRSKRRLPSATLPKPKLSRLEEEEEPKSDRSAVDVVIMPPPILTNPSPRIRALDERILPVKTPPKSPPPLSKNSASFCVRELFGDGGPKLPPAKKIETKDAETQSTYPAIDWSKVNIVDVISQRRAADPTIATDVDALFQLLPGTMSLLLQNQDILCKRLSIRVQPPTPPVTRPIVQTQPILARQHSPLSRNRSASLRPKRILSQQYKPFIVPKKTISNSTDEDVGDTQPLLSNMHTSRNSAPTPDRDSDAEFVPATPSGSSTPLKLDIYDEKENLRDSFDADLTVRLSQTENYHPWTTEEEEISKNLTESMVMSISRIQSGEDEDLQHEFSIMFPRVRIIDDVTSECTHLVMMNTQGRVCSNRSLKYTFAVAYRCELLGREWMVECVNKKRLVATSQFTVQAGNSTLSQSQLTAWQRSRVSTKPLLADKKFLLPKTFSDHHLVPRTKLMELIVACGGTVISKMWELQPADSYIIFMPDSRERDSAMRYEHDTRVPVVNADWLLDSVSEFRVITSIDKYRVYKSTTQF